MRGRSSVPELRLFLEETGQSGPLPLRSGSRPPAHNLAGLGQELGRELRAVRGEGAGHGKHPVAEQGRRSMQLPSNYEKNAPAKT